MVAKKLTVIDNANIVRSALQRSIADGTDCLVPARWHGPTVRGDGSTGRQKRISSLSEKRRSLLATRSGAPLSPGSARYWFRLARCLGSRPSTQATTASMASSAPFGLGRSTRRDLCETTNPSRSENDVGRGPSPERPRPTHDATPPREVEQFAESPPSGPVRPSRHAQSSTRSSRSGVIL